MSVNGGRYDTVLANGRVICPAGDVDAVMDVAVRDEKIAALGPCLAAGAVETLDCSGKIVTPGLIDSHVHIYTSAHNSMSTDDAGVGSGATTVVDGGSSGYMTFDDFRRRDIDGKATDAYVYLHHNPIGQAVMPEIWAPSRIRTDRQRIVEIIKAHRGRIIGLKDRAVGTFIAHQGIRGVEEAREICAECGVPYVIHLGIDAVDELPDRELDTFTRELLGLMRPGDILSHICTPKRGRLFREDGAFDREIRAAYERGVVFDCCCGASNFSGNAFRLGRERGFLPHTLTTDITMMAVKGPAKNLGVIMSKILALGVDLPTVIKWTTSEPARVIGMADRKGRLEVGRQADITVSEIRKGEWRFLDHFSGKQFDGGELFVPRFAFVAGKKHVVRFSGGPTLPE